MSSEGYDDDEGKDGVAKDAYILPEITNSVYKLDVDEDIWLAQSTEGLAQFPGGVVPAWLSDASVRVGIRAAQEVVNCKEELKRCAAEHSNLCQWVETEYLATQFVLNHSADRLNWFFNIVSMWQKDLDGVPFEGSGGSISTFLPEIPPPIPGMDTWDHAKDEEGCGRSDATGGKLYNIVVEDETVGMQLLNKGNLKKRVTIISLNQINVFRASVEKLMAASKITPGKAHLVLSLVGYAEEISLAIAYIFDDTMICDDAESAKAITFNKAIMLKSVTIQGDIYDPAGLLSGGSAPSGSGTLLKVQELNKAKAKLAQANTVLQHIEKEEASVKEARDLWKHLEHELEIKSHKHGTLGTTKVEVLKQTFAKLKNTVEAAKKKQRDAKDECKKFKRDIDNFKHNKGSKLKEVWSDIANQKARLSKQAAPLKILQRELQTTSLELEQTEMDIESSAQYVQEAKNSVAIIVKEIEALAKEQEAQQVSHDEVEAKLKKERADLMRFDEELQDLDRAIKEKHQAAADAWLKIKEAEHSITALQKECIFGKAGSAYDFSKRDVAQEKETARELEDQLKGMKKTINPKVMGMIESVKKKEAELLTMLSTVMGDKVKIEDTIAELERHK
ncbi:hypothetical protein BS47DRAFT_1448463 [Hydnum rufescens UP504]|uniref:SMC hinge domain-containing protein n=1 Tax=Hydnum rufescens UP504 TaxID=1448309 RepID=A0A9P6ADW7_9AGAM|nr:hypothetical protein BS47DRAFT_1448463 [Hydnum rufescens UP504]